MRFSDRADVEDEFDGPESFAEAGEYVSVMSLGKLAPQRAAELLSKAARAGLIVSVDLHNEVCDQYAAALQQAHSAADELVQRLEGRSS